MADGLIPCENCGKRLPVEEINNSLCPQCDKRESRKRPITIPVQSTDQNWDISEGSNTNQPSSNNTTSNMGQDPVKKVSLSKTFTCVNCEDWEISKKYQGVDNTDAKKHYDRIESPDSCPVCGGAIQEKQDSTPPR